jgi:long-chain acyl-CoA synthetase
MEIKRVFDILELYKTQYRKNDVLSSKVNKSWKKYSSDDLINYSNWVSYALIKMGLSPQDKISIISSNRPEWNFCDFGSQQANIITVPIFPTISNHDLQFILNHSEAKLIFISDKAIYTKLVALEKELPFVKHIISFEKIDGLMSFDEFINLGIENEAFDTVKTIKESILPSNLLTILYTSGTTGIPKGVMVAHSNMVSNVIACQGFAPFESTWKALSFLPLNHVYERMVCTLYLYKGISIYYAEGLETIGDNLKEIQPQIFVSVPRLIERVYEKITATGEKLTGMKRKIFDWSLRIANKYEPNNKNGLWYNIQHKIADKLVYSKWRAAVGGKLVCIASGGAALNPKLERIFLCANIVCLQGYGLTETCVVVSVNRYGDDNIRIGTCGPVIEGVQVKIAEENGEILVKGPNVMSGYYKNEEATKEVIDQEGWFHTGDVGTFVEGKFLKITDRIKEIFKTSSGKYIAPLMIENKIKESRFVEQSMVIGEGQKHASALIVPSFTNFREFCKDNSIEWTTNEEMSKHVELKRIINEHLKQINKVLAPYEQLKRWEILTSDWSIEGGELTPKMSLKRKVIKEKNIIVINKIFAIEED